MGVHLYTNGAWTDSGKIYRNSLNLFNLSNPNVFYGFVNESGNFRSFPNNALVVLNLPNGIYTISGFKKYPPDSVVRIVTSNVTPAFDVPVATNVLRPQNTTYTITINDDNYLSIMVCGDSDYNYYNNVQTAISANCENLMINAGSTALPYEPYNVVDWYTNNGHDYSSGAWS